ncbi:MAG TPA: type III pantothenate kinase [Planctomycetota bacterium]|nr:type III pantothenate kinase [Planctomycetota bacterium]
MRASLLTIDVGNSAAKLRAWSVDPAGALSCASRLDVTSADPAGTVLAEFFDGNPGLELAAMSSVSGAEITSNWRSLVGARTRARLFAELDCGLANRTLEPERVGRDRLFAARGALECLGESAIVIDVGTAITVDALLTAKSERSKDAWRRGEFLGGAIAPGPQLLARALASGTARLFEVVPTTAPRALGRDTSEAMHAGIGVGIRGAVRELALEIAREAGFDDPPIALTGGARAFVVAAFGARRVLDSEDLVHLGLCAALLEEAGQPRPAAFGAR